MATNSLVIKARILKTEDLTLCLPKSIFEQHDAFCQETRMLMRQNVNNAVSKDSTIDKRFTIL